MLLSAPGWPEDDDEAVAPAEDSHGQEFFGMSGARTPLLSTLCARRLTGDAMQSLLLVAAGTADLVPKSAGENDGAGADDDDDEDADRWFFLSSPAAPQILAPGEWVGSTTLFAPEHATECGELVPGTRSAMTLVLALPRTQLVQFVLTLPSGLARLKAWIRRPKKAPASGKGKGKGDADEAAGWFFGH